jgi:hypothetical protein
MTRDILSDNDQALRERLVAMPLSTLFNARETALVTGLSVGALSNRRALGMWPFPVRIPGAGRIVRYRHGDLLASAEPADCRVHDTATRQSTINP